MTNAEVIECKKYAESKGFKLFHYGCVLGGIEDVIYMDNVENCYNIICNIFDNSNSKTSNIYMHYINCEKSKNYLVCSARADKVETIDQFKTLLDNRIKRWKLCKQELKLNKLKEDF